MQRNTVQKAIILKTVRSMTNHPSADEVYERVALLCPNISRATVYRDLNAFADSGELLRVSVANAPDRYDFTVENHAHSLCSVCGRVSDYRLNCIPSLSEDSGFRVKSVSIIVNGVCHECARKTEETQKNC